MPIPRSCSGLFTLLVGCIPLWSCGDGEGERPRAVVIGIDSADWTMIDQLVDAGDLPHLARLRQRGTWGELATLSDIPLSPVVWTSVATGKSPAKHGVTWFLVDQPDGSRQPVQSTNRRTEAIWTIADRAGLSVNSIGWWATYPAERLDHGVMISDAMGYHGFGSTARDNDDSGKVSPAGLFADFDAHMPPDHQVQAPLVQRFVDISTAEFERERFNPARNSTRHPFNPIHLFQQYAVTAEGYTSIAKELLDEDGYDLMLLYYEQVDSLSHLFMKYDLPRLEWVDERGFGRYQRTVREWYRHQDEMLGELLERIDLEETAVFIVSDHGFKVGDRRIRSEQTVDIKKAHLDHETQGVFLAAGPGIHRGKRIEGASVLDITPTVLHYLGLPVGKDMDGRVLQETFQGEDGRERAVRYVATHETGEDRRVMALEGTAGAADLEAGLRALGYMGEDPDAEQASGADAAAPASSPELHNNLGRIYLQRGEMAAGLAEFQRSLELDAGNPDALLAIGGVMRVQGRTEEAKHYVERALAADPNSSAALGQLADLAKSRGELKEAARLYREALELTDAQPGLYNGFGDVLQRAGNLEGAEAAFQRALELDPDDVFAHYNLGVTLRKLGRDDDAMLRYGRALELGAGRPEAAFILNNIGAIHRDAGRLDEALEAFEQAAEGAPGHLESRFNAAMIHVDRGHHDRAIVRLEEAAALAPNHGQVQCELGLLYFGADRFDEARRSLMLVRRRYPDNWRATIGLSALQVQAGLEEDATALLAEAVKRSNGQAVAFAGEFELLRPYVKLIE